MLLCAAKIHVSSTSLFRIRISLAQANNSTSKISIGEVPVPKKTILVTRQPNAKSDGVGDVNAGPLNR